MFYFRIKYYCLRIAMLVLTYVLRITTVFVTVTTTYHFKMLFVNCIELYDIFKHKTNGPVSISVIEKLQSWNLLARDGMLKCKNCHYLKLYPDVRSLNGFIQLTKNRALHSGIWMSPYEALFGYKVKVGLSTSNLPKEYLLVAYSYFLLLFCNFMQLIYMYVTAHQLKRLLTVSLVVNRKFTGRDKVRACRENVENLITVLILMCGGSCFNPLLYLHLIAVGNRMNNIIYSNSNVVWITILQNAVVVNTAVLCFAVSFVAESCKYGDNIIIMIYESKVRQPPIDNPSGGKKPSQSGVGLTGKWIPERMRLP
ncbi:hypothetical protein QTP88_005796 [Uroleucon formosanum]